MKLYIRLGWLFDDICGSMYSFGLSSFVVLDIVNLLTRVAAGLGPRGAQGGRCAYIVRQVLRDGHVLYFVVHSFRT